MTAIIIPIESEGSSFFSKRYAIVSPIPAKAAFDKNTLKFETNLWDKKVQKNKKKFLRRGQKKQHG